MFIKRGLKWSRGGWQLHGGKEFLKNYVIDDVVENHEESGQLRMKGYDQTKAKISIGWQIGWAQGVADDDKVGKKLDP